LSTNSVIAGYQGIRYAADRGVKVINLSWGGPGDPATTQGVQAVIDYAYGKGALVVAASGNDGVNNDVQPHFPADLNHVLSVGSTNSLDSASGFSCYGVSVDVWAPGEGIYTTTAGGYERIDGTSFSSPITSGVAALVFAQHPTWTPDQVAMQLRATGENFRIRNNSLRPYYFHRINAFRAVSINSDLTSGAPTNLPGIGVVSYTLNGKATDTIKSFDQVVTVGLTIKNYLAPTQAMRIEAAPNQTLTTLTGVDIPVLGTLQTATTELQVRIAADAPIVYSEGALQLVLHITDGTYEDYAAVRIPVYLPGWHKQADPYLVQQTSLYALSGLTAVSPTIAWAVANVSNTTPVFTRTSNGGLWTTFSQIPPGQEAVYCIDATSDKNAWSGSGPSSGQAGVFKTTNGGSSWTRTSVATITPFVDAIHMFDDQNGILIGDPLSGKWGIGITTNGGTTWSPLASPLTAGGASEAGWNNSFAANGDNLWFGTNNARIYRSVDRGRTWTGYPTPDNHSFHISMATENDGMASFAPNSSAGTGRNSIAITHDGGVTWTAATLPFTGAFPGGITYKKSQAGDVTMYLSTQNGIYSTTDYGTSWTQMAVPSITMDGVLLDAAQDSTGKFQAYGANLYSQIFGIKETLPTGVRNDDGIAGGNVTLYHNEPNPAVSTTRISFDLKNSASVSLDVRDVLGMSIQRRDLGRVESGHHSLTMDLSAIPAGSYYYTINCNGENFTRRMIVVK
jgi:hypothetical protein